MMFLFQLAMLLSCSFVRPSHSLKRLFCSEHPAPELCRVRHRIMPRESSLVLAVLSLNHFRSSCCFRGTRSGPSWPLGGSPLWLLWLLQALIPWWSCSWSPLAAVPSPGRLAAAGFQSAKRSPFWRWSLTAGPGPLALGWFAPLVAPAPTGAIPCCLRSLSS